MASQINLSHFNDQELAGILRTQVRQDSMTIQGIPPMQQMIVEAIARILERPVFLVNQTPQEPGEMRKAVPQIVKG